MSLLIQNKIRLLALLVLAFPGTLFFGCQDLANNSPPAIQPHASFEIRWASETPKDDYAEIRFKNDDRTAWVSKDVILDQRGLAVVRSGISSDGNEKLELLFTDSAAAKMLEATSDANGRMIAIIADGKLIKTHSITGPVENRAELSGWTGDEINWLTHYLYAPE